jgi:hypothetical protein
LRLAVNPGQLAGMTGTILRARSRWLLPKKTNLATGTVLALPLTCRRPSLNVVRKLLGRSLDDHRIKARDSGARLFRRTLARRRPHLRDRSLRLNFASFNLMFRKKDSTNFTPSETRSCLSRSVARVLQYASDRASQCPVPQPASMCCHRFQRERCRDQPWDRIPSARCRRHRW